jgi:hypothetical protein
MIARCLIASPDPTVGSNGSPVIGNQTLYFLDGVLLGRGDRPSLPFTIKTRAIGSSSSIS